MLPQFRASDLRIPDGLHGALGRAATPVRTYYLSGLNRADGAGREEAAKVLNEVIDEAIKKVFRLDQATGGVTLESIILGVRKLLLDQGRELVLLIEDFAALSGIQQTLLSVCIQEAERDGRQVCSRMRTALALTEGYLVAHDTIATRARHEWLIQQSTGTDDVIDRSVELIGAYLNAARWGGKALQDKFQQSSHLEESDLTAWIDTFEYDDLTPEVSEQLAAFGTSERGVPLFPYNRLAVAELAKRHLAQSRGDTAQSTARHQLYAARHSLVRSRRLRDRETFRQRASRTPTRRRRLPAGSPPNPHRKQNASAWKP